MRKILISCCCPLLLSSLVYAGECMDVMGVPYTIVQSPWEFSEGTIEVALSTNILDTFAYPDVRK